MFESAGGRGESGNKTDSRFFWLGLYVQPALWIGLAVMAVLTLKIVWLSVIGKYCFTFGGNNRFGRASRGEALDGGS